MRSVPILAAVLAFAAAAAAALQATHPAAPALEVAHAASQGGLPTWALFSFAVSAFREPLR